MALNLPDKNLMTVAEAAASIRVSEESIRRWMREGVIPYEPVGNRKMIRKSSLLTSDAADAMPTAATAAIATHIDPVAEERHNFINSIIKNQPKIGVNNGSDPVSSALTDISITINPRQSSRQPKHFKGSSGSKQDSHTNGR